LVEVRQGASRREGERVKADADESSLKRCYRLAAQRGFVIKTRDYFTFHVQDQRTGRRVALIYGIKWLERLLAPPNEDGVDNEKMRPTPTCPAPQVSPN
jgi:hypothetical protein